MPEHPIPESVIRRRRAVGERVRRARIHANLTQERLSEDADLSRATIIRIEAGTSSPVLDHLLMICDALRIPLADLVRE